jgi:hypothetical protein
MKRLNRRAVLRGLGVTMALPFLDVMRAPTARAQAAASPKRLFFYFTPCGINMNRWTPDSEGRNFDLPHILEPIDAIKDKALVVSGVRNTAAMDLGDGPGDHARGTGAFLTATHPLKSEGRVQNGASVDQVAAQALRGKTRLASLELGCEQGALVGSCDIGYSCAYQNNISWASSTVPMPKEINPRAAFDRLFQGAEAGLTPEEREARRRRRSSVLDFVRGDASRLQSKLGARDRQKLDEYLTSVRELERGIEDAPDVTCSFPDRPAGADSEVQKYVRQMLDLVVLAFRCDLVRVASFMFGNGASNRSYSFIGHSGGHHEYSHHQNDAGKLQALADIGRFEVAQLAYLAKELDKIDEGDGTALDNSVLFMSSELEDGNAHSHTNMPLLLLGKGGGMLDTGRHVRVEDSTEFGDVFLTLLRTVGVEQASFGQTGTRVIDSLVAS